MDRSTLQEVFSRWPFWKQQAFLALLCQRLVPNFHAFENEIGRPNDPTLDRLVDKAWTMLESGEVPSDVLKDAGAAEALGPETEDHTTVLVSAALDAAVAVGLLMRTFVERDTETVLDAHALVRDTLEMYIEQTEELQPNDPSLEARLHEHPLVQAERRHQADAVATLDRLPEADTASSVRAIRSSELARGGTGCLAIDV